MKVPLRLAGKLLLGGLDLGLTAAMRLNDWLDARKARKREAERRGLTYKEVAHIQDQISRSTRSRAPTVIIPKK